MEWAQGGGHRLHRQTRSQAGGGGAEFRLRWQQAKGPVRGWVGDGTTAVLAVCGARAPRSKFWGYDLVLELMFCHYADVSSLGT